MDTLDYIGQIYTEETELRDAVHFAVISVMAGENLNPGTPVALVNNVVIHWSPRNEAIGVIDPFLPCPVPAGAECILFLLPKSTRNLRHTWEHAAFPTRAEATTAATVEVLANKLMGRASALDTLTVLANAYGMDAHTVINTSKDNWCKNTDNDLPDAFWDAYKEVTGIDVDYDDRYVSCAC